MENTRFADLRKVPKQPALRLVAIANGKLKTKLKAPANSTVSDVLIELASMDKDLNAHLDMLRIMAAALPARERVWWTCLAGRDIIGPDVEEVPLTLKLSEEWVRKPSDDLREKVREAVELADSDDEMDMCGATVQFYDDTLGTGDLAKHAAPPGASQNSALTMVSKAVAPLAARLDVDLFTAINIHIDRAVDISRGGNGQIQSAATKEQTS
jgi:hypothetical protein